MGTNSSISVYISKEGSCVRETGSTMADTATPRTSDRTKQKQLLRLAKVKLPTLAAGTSPNNHFDHAGPFNFELIRSEADKGQLLPAALFSNDFFRIPGLSSLSQSRTELVQKPLCMLAGLFSEIKQELTMEARKFSLIQSEYLKECIRRSRIPAIYRNIRPETDETASTRVVQLKNNLSFLVRLFFEIMEGPEGIKIKGACDMPSLPDIYSGSSNEPKAAPETVPVDTSSVKQLSDATSFNDSPISGFNSLFGIKRK